MVVEATGAGETAVLARDAIPPPSSLRTLAHNLAKELTAPVAIFDARAKRWRVVVGADEEQFPGVTDQFLSKSRSIELKLGQAMLWKRVDDRGRVWLLLPVSVAGGEGFVAVAGFRTASGARGGPGSNDSRSLGESAEPVRWGPSCPEPALLAWGQQVVSRLGSERGMRLAPATPPRSRDEESERVVIGRLIRRLRISDPPQHFQTVATTVLRWSLNMTAVAWVPRAETDPVIWSGDVPGLEGEAYRSLPAPAGRESLYVLNDPSVESSMGIPPGVQRFASVAAGSFGYLVAINPLADRSIVRADIERLQFVASLIATQVSNVKIYSDLKELLFGIIRGLTTAIDAKDTYTSGHSERVARIAVRLGHELGLPPAKLSDLYLAGLLHDVGKIGIDDVVLKKCGPLTPEEHKKIQSHVVIGVTILKDIKMLHHILPTVRHHHESLDGTGYPDKLLGNEIPLEARILAVADAFDAMSNNRPYRNRLSLAQIDRILREGRGVQWDPQVIDALYACRSDLEAIGEKGVGESLIGVVDIAVERG